MKLNITAIILTFNEKRNLPECINSIKDFVNEIIVVDSFSTDETIEIAKSYGCKTYQNIFINQAKQFIWAIENAVITNEWILRIDADERWTEEGFYELRNLIESGKYDGIYVKMKYFVMGRWMKHGDHYPNYFMRVYKKDKGQMEDRWMDEHIKVTGNTIISNIDVIESNYDRQKNITLWTTKHNNYSTREAIEFLTVKYNLHQFNSVAKLSGNKTERKRWMKENFYFRMPLFIRPFLYYTYRYIFKLGFLDGKEGFIYHYLHAFWYRFLVDAKIYQLESLSRKEKKSIQDVINEHYGIKISN